MCAGHYRYRCVLSDDEIVSPSLVSGPPSARPGATRVLKFWHRCYIIICVEMHGALSISLVECTYSRCRVNNSVSKGASKTRDPRSEPDFWLIREPWRVANLWRSCPKLRRQSPGYQYQSQWIHLDMSLEHPETQNQPRTAARVTDGEIMYILWLLHFIL